MKMDIIDKNSKENKNLKEIKEIDLNNISLIKPNKDNKNSFEDSFLDDDEFTLEIEKMKEITKKQRKMVENKIQIDKEESNKENIEKVKENKNIIPLKDDPKFKTQDNISNIEKDLKDLIKYDTKNDIANKLKFTEIKHDDVLDFNDEEKIIPFFKSINFILSEDSKKRLNLLYFCIKYGFHILIPGPTGTGKTYLSESICNLLNKKMIKYNCSENTKFPNLKFTCQGDKKKICRNNIY